MTAGSFAAFLYILYEFANLLFILSYYVLTFSPTLGYVTGLNIPNSVGYIYIILIPTPYAVNGRIPIFGEVTIIAIDKDTTNTI